MKAVGYVRVSTREQGDSGLGLQAQKEKLSLEANRRDWQLRDVVTEVASAASVRKRPVLSRLLEQLDAGEYDALLVTRLDRVSRSVIDVSELMARAGRNGWALVMLEPAVDMSTPMGEAIANVMATFAQFERRMIGQRTREGLAVARERGTFRPGEATRYQDEDGIARILELHELGLSYRGIADRLTLEGVPTSRDGVVWSFSTVRKIIKREKEQHGTPARAR